MPGKTLDLEALKTQATPLSDDQQAEIAAQAIAEAEAEEKKVKDETPLDLDDGKEKEPEKKEEESKEEGKKADEELLSAKDEELSEEDKTRKAELVKANEDQLINAKDEELSVEDKAKKAEIVKAREDSKKKSEDDEIAAYAKESNITIEAAREELGHVSKIQEKYKGDPKQLARANLHIQRLYTKTQEEAKALKDAKPTQPAISVTVDNIAKAIDEGKIMLNGKAATREEIVTAYRENYPDITETLDEETVVKLAAKELKENFEKSLETNKAQQTIQAKDKRETILNSLGEADKKYLAELKPLLDKVSDSGVMDENFSVDTYVNYLKGKHYDEDIKETADREFKRGQEEAKILGEKAPPKPGSPKGKAKRSLTSEQKQRALDMYDTDVMTEEQKYDAYIDYLDGEDKKK
uniref:Uncharacterized protein n=1 Tax=viral metagenome TaxID=1070528 RepID=A0A6M3XK50_9ZZZZ